MATTRIETVPEPTRIHESVEASSRTSLPRGNLVSEGVHGRTVEPSSAPVSPQVKMARLVVRQQMNPASRQ